VLITTNVINSTPSHAKQPGKVTLLTGVRVTFTFCVYTCQSLKILYGKAATSGCACP
jgi:hypothetical protein